jgi:mannosyltransferase OCH1-like enzyme
MNLTKRMVHIWIGPYEPPLDWMNTWKEKHPDWEYMVFTDEMLKSRKWHNQHLIDEYYRRGTWAGVADLIRYELLYEGGGFLPPADAVCLHNTDELFTSPPDHAYSVYENDRDKHLAPNYISPIMACNAGNTFVKLLIDTLHKLPANQLQPAPWKSTGNAWLSKFVPNKEQHKLIIWPSHYLIPKHYSIRSTPYKGDDKIYAEQMWGSTKRRYKKIKL